MKPITDQPEQEPEINGSPENALHPYKRLQYRRTSSTDGSNEVQYVEMVYKEKAIPSWKNQLTLRALVVSLVLGTLFTVLLLKLRLTTGVILIPAYMHPGLVGYSCIKTWITIVERCGILGQPFTRQENTMIQVCVLAITRVALNGGLASYLFAMGSNVAKQMPTTEGDDSLNIKEPDIAWIIPYLLVTSFVGLGAMVPLRKFMLINLKLVYPTGQAIGHLTNCINAPFTTKFARKQFTTLAKFFSFSFFWSCFLWLFTGGIGCGFQKMPLLGSAAFEKGFAFDFIGTNIGTGMLLTYNTCISILIATIFCSGFLLPYLRSKAGVWYDKTLSSDDYRGMYGYQDYGGLIMMFADCLYNFLRIVGVALFHKLRNKYSTADDHLQSPPPDDHDQTSPCRSDEQIRTQHFLNDPIPTKLATVAGAALVAISAIVLPLIFRPLKWYYVVAAYMTSFFLAFIQAHVIGLCDVTLNPASLDIRAVYVFGAWAGIAQGGVLVGLVACAIITNFISAAADLMTDLRTSYLTMASPKSVFVYKVIGTALGCFISSLTFWYFEKHDRDFGTDNAFYTAYVGSNFRQTAIYGVEGFTGFPKHYLEFWCALFIMGIVINVIKDVLPKKVAGYVPNPTALAVAFYVSGQFSVTISVGNLIVFLWRCRRKDQADAFAPIVASALICGDGLWNLVSSVFAFVGLINPPWCVQFVSGEPNG